MKSILLVVLLVTVGCESKPPTYHLVTTVWENGDTNASDSEIKSAFQAEPTCQGVIIDSRKDAPGPLLVFVSVDKQSRIHADPHFDVSGSTHEVIVKFCRYAKGEGASVN